MPSLLQDLGVAEEALADLAAFAAGQPINATISGYAASIVHLPNGPTPPYVVISGSVLNILVTVLGMYAAFESDAPIAIAAKEGNTWYGITLAKPAAPAAPSAAA